MACGFWTYLFLSIFLVGKVKKTDHSHRHLGFLAFSGSISPISPCHCKWLSNVIFLKCWWTPGVSKCFQNCVFFWPRPLMPPCYTHKKNQSTMAGPQMYEVSSRKGCGKHIHDLLTGGGLLLAPGCFCAYSLFLSGLHHDFGTCFNYFLATLRLREQNNVFLDEMPFIHKVWMGPHVDMHFCGSAHHDEISCMFTRWGHELDWGVVYNYMSM